jgi:protein gp37
VSETTKIQWTDSTFNPWRGCTKIASGCTNCYADTLAKRNPKTLGIWGPNGTRVLASSAMWKEPVKWNMEVASYDGQHRVFCASLADVFEEWHGAIHSHGGHKLGIGEDGKLCFEGTRAATLDDVRAKLFHLIDATPYLTWQILTKRPGNILPMWCSHANTDGKPPSRLHRNNVHLLYSASNQTDLESGIGDLLKCRNLVPVIGLSLEPLVGPITFRWASWNESSPENHLDGLRKLDWVIVGGESGPNARPCNIAWIRDIVRQCKEAGVPCFVKQLGANIIDEREGAEVWMRRGAKEIHAINSKVYVKPGDKKGGGWNEWPEDLRVRQFPNVEVAA